MWRILRTWRLRRLARRNPYRSLGPTYTGPFGPAFYSSINLHARSPAESRRIRKRRRMRRIRIAAVVVALLALGWMLGESLRALRLF